MFVRTHTNVTDSVQPLTANDRSVWDTPNDCTLIATRFTKCYNALLAGTLQPFWETEATPESRGRWLSRFGSMLNPESSKLLCMATAPKAHDFLALPDARQDNHMGVYAVVLVPNEGSDKPLTVYVGSGSKPVIIGVTTGKPTRLGVRLRALTTIGVPCLFHCPRTLSDRAQYTNGAGP